MRHGLHLLFLTLQAGLIWYSLQAFPGLFKHWEEGVSAIYPARPMPGITESMIAVAEILEEISFEWPYICLVLVATHLSVGFCLIFSQKDTRISLQRSYLYQISVTLLLAALFFLWAVSSLMPFVTIYGSMQLTSLTKITLHEVFWGSFTFIYSIALGSVCVLVILKHQRSSNTSM